MPSRLIPLEPLALVAASLRELERRLTQLVAALMHDRTAWVAIDGIGDARHAMAAACTAFGAIDLPMDAAPSSSVVCLGVVGTSLDVLAVAESVNDAKASLRAICAPLQRVRLRVPDPATEGASTRPVPLIRLILRSIQRSDLNLLAAYRRIPILGAHPRSVSYTRAHTRSVYRKSIADVAALLDNDDAPRAHLDRMRLAALPAAETHLAVVRGHYENIRANVTFDGLDHLGRGRVMVVAELPLLYAARRGGAVPRVAFPPAPGTPQPPPRVRRTKLEPRPLLESVPAYRYRPEFR